MFAREHPGPGVFIARHAKPVLAEPDAVRRNHRFVVGQLLADREGSAKRLGKLHAREHVLHGRRGARHLERQRGVHVVYDAVLRLFAQYRYGARTQLRDALRYRCNIGDADGLQIIAKHRFHGLVPAILDIERLSNSLVAVEPGAREPVLDAVVALAHRRLLQGFERCVLALHVL